MNIRPVPMNDFIVYLEEQILAERQTAYKHILDLMDEYYCLLNDNCASIVPAGGDYITAWSNFNNEDEVPEDLVAGMILYKDDYKGARHYGIVFQPSHYVKNGTARPEDACVITLDQRGHLVATNVNPEDWDGYGVPCRYFYYKDENLYKDIMSYNLGDRSLCLGMRGYDIEQLYALIKHKYPEATLSITFTPELKAYLEDIQRQCGARITGFLSLRNADGQKVMRWLTDGYTTEAIS